jgi:hypothetical protein
MERTILNWKAGLERQGLHYLVQVNKSDEVFFLI